MISQNLHRHHSQDENNKQYVCWLITSTGRATLWRSEKHAFQTFTVQCVSIQLGEKYQKKQKPNPTTTKKETNPNQCFSFYLLRRFYTKIICTPKINTYTIDSSSNLHPSISTGVEKSFLVSPEKKFLCQNKHVCTRANKRHCILSVMINKRFIFNYLQ